MLPLPLALLLALTACGDSGGGSVVPMGGADGSVDDASIEDAAMTGTDATTAGDGGGSADPCGDGVRDEDEVCDTASDACCASDCRGVVAAGTVCRPAAGDCDVAESCDGSESGCPADAFVASGTECRAQAGACDVAESCTGGDPACPRNRFVEEGTECRAAVDVCDAPEECPGKAADCPDDEAAPAGTVCDDGVFCNGIDACDGDGTCAHPGDPCVVECSDICDEDADVCDTELDGLTCSVGECDSGRCCPGATEGTPDGCVLAAARIVFVTSQTVDGDLLGVDGIADGDALCNELAAAANLAGTFTAWLSDTKAHAKDRIGAGPFHRIDGTEVAKNAGDLLDGVITVAIDRDELGVAVGPANVWTAATDAGTRIGNHCSSWTSADSGDDAVHGCTNATNGAWTNCATVSCDTTSRLYCFQDD